MSLDRGSFRKCTGVVTAAARSDDELAYRSEANVGAGLVDAVAAVELARALGGRAARCRRTPITRPRPPGVELRDPGTGRTVEE